MVKTNFRKSKKTKMRRNTKKNTKGGNSLKLFHELTKDVKPPSESKVLKTNGLDMFHDLTKDIKPPSESKVLKGLKSDGLKLFHELTKDVKPPSESKVLKSKDVK